MHHHRDKNQRRRDRKTGRGRHTAREQKPDTQEGQGTTHTKKETKKEAGAHRKEKQNEDREMRPERVPTQTPVEQLFTRQGFHLPVPGLHLTPADSMREESDRGNWVTEARR